MNRKFKPNRQGITLLFVISMIVLFLLMGTAFVVVSNNFNRESRNRIHSNEAEGTGSTQGKQIIDDVINQLIRGTDLRNVDSPLRTSDMLADQYGYGVRAVVATSAIVDGSSVNDSSFIVLTLQSGTGVADNGFDFRTLAEAPLSPDGLGGTFGGRVLSFTSGPAKGFSVRIYADAFNGGGSLRFQIPTSTFNGDSIANLGLTNVNELDGSEVIINGRDFSGIGAAATVDGNGEPESPLSLGTEAGSPNRAGDSLAILTSTYLTTSNSVNEPWDAPDVATPFLSGFDENGELLASFHSDDSFKAFGTAEPEVDTTGDGVNDSFWMDLGLPIGTNREGQRFRPLVAVHIRDLDGLLSVNAHSNRTHLDGSGTGFVNQAHDWAGVGGAIGPEPGKPRGSGMGPPEINLTAALSQAQLRNILNGRYGADGLPGNAGNPTAPDSSFRSRAKHFGHPIGNANTDGTVGGFYGSSAMDIHGRFRLGSPLTSAFPDPNYPALVNGLPQIDMLSSVSIDNDAYSNEFDGNAYEMSLTGTALEDTPFTLQELESLLRPNDIDSRLLPARLSSLISSTAEQNEDLGADNKKLNLYTTDSFEVPMLYGTFAEDVVRNIQLRTATATPTLTEPQRVGLANLLAGQVAFAPEFYFGLKMDINRPFGQGLDDNSNGVVDDPSEITTTAITDNAVSHARDLLATDSEIRLDLNYSEVHTTGAQNPRVIFARNLYMLAMLLLEPVDFEDDGTVDANDQLKFAKAMAQWAVNVVDFRDTDSIHTRFVYDPTPFEASGWAPVLDVTDNNGLVTTPAPFAVWGCERPELLLSETLAVHIQNMEDNSGYEQRLRPEPFAFFEVHNPWTQNNLNQLPPQELYNGEVGVDLGHMAGTSPVWRFEVERADPSNNTGFKPLRYVYMADPTGSSITYDNTDDDQTETDIEIFFGTGGAIVEPGKQAVIGTKGFAEQGNANSFQVFMGRKTLADDTTGNADDIMLDETTRLALDSNAGTVTRYTGGNLDNTRETSILFIDQSTTGSNRATAQNRKFSLSDQYQGYPDTAVAIPNGDGSIYATPFPNPLDEEDGERINATDIAMIRNQGGISKNFRYVRLQRLANPLLAWDANTNPYLTIDSMEVDLVSINGADAPDMSLPAAGQTQAVSHERGDANRTLWGFQREGAIRASTGAASADHHYDEAFTDSLGRTNDIFDPTNANGAPFAWLTWNNRPFVSHMEIMNVPYLAPEQLTYSAEGSEAALFSIDDGSLADPYMDKRTGTDVEIMAGRYGHLLNFFGGELDSDGTNNFADAYKLLDYLEVPNRFVGNESWYLTNNAKDVLRYPFNIISHYRAPGKINLNTIPPSEIGSTESIVWQALGTPGVDWNTFKTSLMDNPMRPAAAANLVPDVTEQIPGSECTLLRPDANGTAPLLDYMSTNLADNAMRSAAFRNETRTRLANLTTNRSSVFAGWITVGYFHVDAADAVQNEEVGTQTGDQVRNRGFFIFDRSIPVAYEPGKNHNIDKAIRVKTIIQ